ncbi:hypothetical protein [Nocardia thailandica]|uniref:hypothetical protein n=1 Tax=Nocardia thailandica TaxID=257275 RepID=UPI0002FC6F75|nr:hypothetical protein [Nocardia thailandica]
MPGRKPFGGITVHPATEVVTDWIERGTDYPGGPRPDTARELMMAILVGLDGAFVLGRTLRSAEPRHAPAARVEDQLAHAETPEGATGHRLPG